VSETPEGSVLVEFTTADDDLAASWPFISFFGVAVAAIAGMSLVGIRTRDDDASNAAKSSGPVSVA